MRWVDLRHGASWDLAIERAVESPRCRLHSRGIELYEMGSNVCQVLRNCSDGLFLL